MSLLKEIPVELTNTKFQVQEENVQWSIFMLQTDLCAWVRCSEYC